MIIKEGQWKPCPRCKGTGKEMETRFKGLLSTEQVEIDCQQCKGKKQIFVVLQCSRMSTGMVYLNGTNTIHGFNTTDCIGEACHLWDHNHGGGCLERKAMLKEVHGG